MSKHSEASMIELLHKRYNTKSGNGPRYAGMAHVRSDAGFDAQRTADYIAIDLWPSKGLTLHGHEVKISRSDWLNELKDPDKSAEFMKHVDYWWLVIADPAMVKVGELPEGWGMMTVGGDGNLRVVKQAPRLNKVDLPPVTTGYGGLKPVVAPVHRGLVAAMLRSAIKSATAVRHREAVKDMAAFRAGHTVEESYALDKWSAEASKYLPAETFANVEALKAAIMAQHARGDYGLHGTIYRTYTYTETEWV